MPSGLSRPMQMRVVVPAAPRAMVVNSPPTKILLFAVYPAGRGLGMLGWRMPNGLGATGEFQLRRRVSRKFFQNLSRIFAGEIMQSLHRFPGFRSAGVEPYWADERAKES